ncbi:iron complex transport system permease protein [Actinocorallia herbida]|uniref:Iron complex transport system permease protein n=1 Tax=Actinocorallia herbida TaxID=58109 RepID=A0A3N1CQ80_9ACTN|nr:iron chelate uptake ABC transporter family permease subunit [Actinocorallia herbida]ROO83470.1 iron complex transport system permease protein [Actinocorallia herbida]
MATPAKAPARGTGPKGPGAARVASSLIAALALLALALLASVKYGSLPTSFGAVLDVLRGHGDPYLTTVVESRYPRTLLGLLAGASLAVAGCLMQGVTRNPLAEPGMLGITTGASASIVTASAYFGMSGQMATLLWALPGALLAGIVVYVVGTRGGGSGMVRLVLTGAVLSAVLSAFIQAVTLSNPKVFDSYRYWVVGSLGGRGFEVFWTVLPLTAVALAVALLLGGSLNTVALGDDSATALGAKPARIKAIGLLAATALGAAATAAVGPIAFVGLAVPHVVRALVGVDFRLQLGFCALLGPSLLLFADVIGRVVLRPQELMVGVVTAFVGAPALLIAVRRMKGTA